MAEECLHPEHRQSWWEQETEGCLSCHRPIRHRHLFNFVGFVIALPSMLLLFGWMVVVGILRKGPLLPSVIAAFFCIATAVFMSREIWWHFNRWRWHTPPADPNRKAQWTGSSWFQT